MEPYSPVLKTGQSDLQKSAASRDPSVRPKKKTVRFSNGDETLTSAGRTIATTDAEQHILPAEKTISSSGILSAQNTFAQYCITHNPQTLMETTSLIENALRNHPDDSTIRQQAKELDAAIAYQKTIDYLLSYMCDEQSSSNLENAILWSKLAGKSSAEKIREKADAIGTSLILIQVSEALLGWRTALQECPTPSTGQNLLERACNTFAGLCQGRADWPGTQSEKKANLLFASLSMERSKYALMSFRSDGLQENLSYALTLINRCIGRECQDVTPEALPLKRDILVTFAKNAEKNFVKYTTDGDLAALQTAWQCINTVLESNDIPIEIRTELTRMRSHILVKKADKDLDLEVLNSII